jgi:hypothetical protein
MPRGHLDAAAPHGYHPTMLEGWRRVATVTSVLLFGCTSSPGVTIAPSSAAPTGPSIESLTIEGLEIDEPRWTADGSRWRLTLTWTAPEGVEVDHYEVRRNGVTVDDAVRSTTFPDPEVKPGARYRYSVIGLDADGEATRAAVARIKTDEPSLAEARLQGTFVVRMRVVRASGTKDPVRGGAIFFSFDPSCAKGACSVRWTVRRSRAQGALQRDEASYTATLRTPFFVRNCFGRLTDETLNVRLRVRAAAPIKRTWRVTKIEGSIEEVSSHPGCKTASIDWDVHGTLQS